MKNKKVITKGQKNFRTGLTIYAGVLAVAVIVVCIIVWNALSRYQKKYDKAEQEGSPDKFAEEFIRELNYDTILSYIGEYGLNEEGSFDYEEMHAEYFAKVLENSQREYRMNERYQQALPIYDIYAGDTRIAVISLQADGKSDEFGFHEWKIKNMAFDTDAIAYQDAEIRIPDGATAEYRGYVLGSDNISEEGGYKDPVREYALSVGAVENKTQTYLIHNVINGADISVKDDNGNELTPQINGSVYDYTLSDSELFLNEIKERVYDTMDAYICNMYNHRSFNEVAAYLEYGSNAYYVVSDVQASIYWGWTPDTIDILSQEIKDCVRYGDNYFSCTYEGRIYKYEEGAMESGEEEFNYRLLFHKLDGKWFLNYFILT